MRKFLNILRDFRDVLLMAVGRDDSEYYEAMD